MAGGFEGGAIRSLRANHSLIRSRGRAFVKSQPSINVVRNQDLIDVERMDDIGRSAQRRIYTRAAIVVVLTTILLIIISL